MKNVVNPYDLLASHYRFFSRKRSRYIEAVDNLIIENIKDVPEKLLDVGSGDGVRIKNIAKKLKAKTLFFLEPSKEMAKKCQKLDKGPVLNINAEDLPRIGIKFDVILCLWNVLGHVNPPKKRMEALIRMRARLKNNGKIIIDINNRHNGSSYGWVEIIKRLIIDKIRPNVTRGDTFYDWEIGKHKIPSRGHLFTPAEMENLFKATGLSVQKRLSVDYNTGHISQNPLLGQLFYVLGKSQI